ncbi:MAG: hypothetical protein HYT89_02060 [Candidatus Omnitrophica bacterium]|nr:hypothetical protein [Candidatus Omnitrophota bacterium]
MNRLVKVLTIALVFSALYSSFDMAESTSVTKEYLKRITEDKRKSREAMAQLGDKAALMELQHRQDLELQQRQFDHEKDLMYQKKIADQQEFNAHHTRCMGALVRRHPEMFDDEGGYLSDSPKGRIWERVAVEHPEYASQIGGLCMAMEEMERILRDEI